MSMYGHLLQEINPKEASRPIGSVLGQITRVVAPYVYFKVPDWSEQHEYGPAPWNHSGSIPTAPADGNWCVVVFVGLGIGRPFVVAWAPSVPWA